MKKIKIAHLYYDLMNLYGENGNVRFLKKKLEDLGIEVEVHFLSIDDKIDFDDYEIFYIGSGSEKNFDVVLEDIMKYKDDIKKAIYDNKYFISTGNSLDLFSKEINYFDGTKKDALSILDCVSYEEEFRIVGEQFYETNVVPDIIVGFQNRCTLIKEYNNKPLFEVINGTGFNPKDDKEGFLYHNFIGTYLFGPLLVRNPFFTDWLVKKICSSYNISYVRPNFDDMPYKAYNEYIKNFYPEKKEQ